MVLLHCPEMFSILNEILSKCDCKKGRLRGTELSQVWALSRILPLLNNFVNLFFFFSKWVYGICSMAQMYKQDSQMILLWKNCLRASVRMECKIHNHQQRATYVNLFQRKTSEALQSSFEHDFALRRSYFCSSPLYDIPLGSKIPWAVSYCGVWSQLLNSCCTLHTTERAPSSIC